MKNRLSVAVAPATPAQNDSQAGLTTDTRLRRPAPNGLATQLLALGNDCASRLAGSWRDLDHGSLLYDDTGLPR